MSNTAVIFNSSPNSFTLYWAILTSKRYEVLSYGENLMTMAEVEALNPVLLIIDHIAGYGLLELDHLRAILARPALVSLPTLIITSALDLYASYPFLHSQPHISVLVQPFDYRTFLASVEQAIQKQEAN